MDEDRDVRGELAVGSADRREQQRKILLGKFSHLNSPQCTPKSMIQHKQVHLFSFNTVIFYVFRVMHVSTHLLCLFLLFYLYKMEFCCERFLLQFALVVVNLVHFMD